MLGSLSVVADPGKPTIVMTRLFDAPPAVVFEAWTKPEHVAQWWDPAGRPLAVCEIDLRPQGAFRWVNRQADGTEHEFAGIYREIRTPELLVFTARTSPSGPESVGTLIFRENKGQTEFSMTIECSSVEHRDAMIKMRVDAGTARTLENLSAYLGQMGTHTREA
jgi:uncharacterized protein YndB with AHSA1/START domain